jgi:hypothetical protein
MIKMYKWRSFAVVVIATMLLSSPGRMVGLQRAQMASSPKQQIQVTSSSKDKEARSSRCAASKLSFRDLSARFRVASARVEQRVASSSIAPPSPPTHLGPLDPDFLRWELMNALNLRMSPLQEGGDCPQSGLCFGECSNGGSMSCSFGAMALSIDGCHWLCCWCDHPEICSGIASCAM